MNYNASAGAQSSAAGGAGCASLGLRAQRLGPLEAVQGRRGRDRPSRDPRQQRGDFARQPADAHEARGVGRCAAANLSSAFYCTEERPSGHDGPVGGASSVSPPSWGWSGIPGRPTTAPQGGADRLSKSVAREYAARGVTVNVVAPGFIGTMETGVLKGAGQGRRPGANPLGHEDVAGRGLLPLRRVPTSPVRSWRLAAE